MVRLVGSGSISNNGWSPETFSSNLLATDHWRLAGQWPSPAGTNAPKHTPTNIERFFSQGVDSLNSANWDAAGTMFRKVVDTATFAIDKDLKSEKLAKRIDELASKHKITPDLREWAHVIRLEGNDAAHEEEPFEEEQAKALHYFAEIFLTYVFSLPGELARRKSETAKKAEQ
jgi:hypothetical protein